MIQQASVPVYIRFGEVPESGKSNIYAGDEVIGQEVGLSVYRAIECDGMYFPQLPKDANKNGVLDYFMFLIQQKHPVYLVTGEEMRFEGQDREPLLQNFTVLKELTPCFRKETYESESEDLS